MGLLSSSLDMVGSLSTTDLPPIGIRLVKLELPAVGILHFLAPCSFAEYTQMN